MGAIKTTQFCLRLRLPATWPPNASPLPVDVKQARQTLGGKSPNKF
jgi:hypothetical protein